jgi:amino acid adenylation domain-containing protein
MPELLQNWVTQQAEVRPDSIAVAGDRTSITYAQLEIRSNRLARLLKDAGYQRGDRIGLLMAKSVEAIVGIIGIYKAGCVYVPLDPAGPPERLTKIIQSCDCRLVLGGLRALDMFAGGHREDTRLKGVSMGWIDDGCAPSHSRIRSAFALEDANGYPSDTLGSGNTGESAAHILFTSGSTGQPKGVVITHRNVISFIEWAVDYFGIDSTDRNSGHPPLPFDLSFLDIFCTFAAGAQLHLVPPEFNVSPKKLTQFIRSRRLTQWFSVPSVLHFLAKFDSIDGEGIPSLKRVMWCGEVLPVPSLIYWMKHVPQAKYTNLYGPTETTIASSYYTVPRCPDASSSIPIGTACGGEELMVLNDGMQKVRQNEVGELCIRGTGVSPGYWNDPETTKSAFVTDPHAPSATDRIYKTGDLATVGADNLFYFLGRRDSQIKSRGYRIELGEIEAALSSIESLRESAVVAIADGDVEAMTICCAYSIQGSGCSPQTLRQTLSLILPNYMLPVRWRLYDLLPRNSSGKIDRKSLKDDFVKSEYGNHKEAYVARHTTG